MNIKTSDLSQFFNSYPSYNEALAQLDIYHQEFLTASKKVGMETKNIQFSKSAFKEEVDMQIYSTYFYTLMENFLNYPHEYIRNTIVEKNFYDIFPHFFNQYLHNIHDFNLLLLCCDDCAYNIKKTSLQLKSSDLVAEDFFEHLLNSIEPSQIQKMNIIGSSVWLDIYNKSKFYFLSDTSIHQFKVFAPFKNPLISLELLNSINNSNSKDILYEALEQNKNLFTTYLIKTIDYHLNQFQLPPDLFFQEFPTIYQLCNTKEKKLLKNNIQAFLHKDNFDPFDLPMEAKTDFFNILLAQIESIDQSIKLQKTLHQKSETKKYKMKL